jgi:hypothetical protein
MKKLFVTLAMASLAVGAFAQGTVGSLTYQNTAGVGKEKYIYGINPSDPTKEIHGNDAALYTGRELLAGTAYWAELWYGAAGAAEGDLKAVEGSLVNFRTGTTAGLIQGKSKLDIAGTLGGDKVTLQLRVWGAQATSWADVLTKPDVARGKSSLILNWELGGVDKDNSPHIGSGNIATGLEKFGLAGS